MNFQQEFSSWLGEYMEHKLSRYINVISLGIWKDIFKSMVILVATLPNSALI